MVLVEDPKVKQVLDHGGGLGGQLQDLGSHQMGLMLRPNGGVWVKSLANLVEVRGSEGI